MAYTSVRATFRAIALLLLAAVSLAAATRYPVTGIILKVDRPHRSFDASWAAIPGLKRLQRPDIMGPRS